MTESVDFQRSPSFLISVLTNRMMRRASQELRSAADVSTTEWAVIAMAGAEPGAPPQRVIEISALDKSVVSRAIKAMEARGLIEVRPHPSHRRKTALYLTKAGKQVHNICLALNIAGDAHMFAAFDEATAQQAIGLFHRLTDQYKTEA
jgi:DNA-binding MarR family transcriptional regulator